MADAARYCCFHLVAPDADEAERAAAEAFAAGASGLEERAAGEGVELVVYAPAALAEVVRSAARGALGAAAALGPLEEVPDRDWSESWKQGLAPLEVSRRLLIRPSFAACTLRPGQRELRIDPGQAFGTGGHASTQLVLAWIDALADSLASDARVLDVGSGTGILSLAVAALSASRVCACDLDGLAGAATRDNARDNGLARRVDVFRGSLDALVGAPRFDLVLANLLRQELEPLIDGIARRTRPGGQVVLAGLLAADLERVAPRAREAGLHLERVRERSDADGNVWVAPLMRRAGAAASPRGRAPGCG